MCPARLKARHAKPKVQQCTVLQQRHHAQVREPSRTQGRPWIHCSKEYNRVAKIGFANSTNNRTTSCFSLSSSLRILKIAFPPESVQTHLFEHVTTTQALKPSPIYLDIQTVFANFFFLLHFALLKEIWEHLFFISEVT